MRIINVIKISATGIPKLSEISRGRLWVCPKNIELFLISNNTGNEDEPHPKNGFWDIK